MKEKLRVFADNLMVHELLHLMLAGAVFLVVYYLFKSLNLSLIAFLLNILIDTDHFFEGILFNGLNFRWILSCPNYWRQSGKMTIFFHSWELLPLILAIGILSGHQTAALTIVIAAASHYLLDHFVYTLWGKMSIFQYFLIYRLYHRFSFNKLCRNHQENVR